MATFTLSPGELDAPHDDAPQREGFGDAILLQHAWWFTRIRWIAAGALAGFGLVCVAMPAALGAVGIAAPARWPWWTAGGLAAANLIHILLLRRVHAPRGHTVRSHLWLQIVVDLLFLSVIVHFIGSTTTFVSFAFLFHIALACIFFGPGESLVVTLLCTALFLGTCVLEITHILGSHSLIRTMPAPPEPLDAIFMAGSAVFIWTVVWYLVSTISRTVRRRDRQLAQANEQLRQADRVRTQEVLQTTHDLKAPFSGIETNVQMLRMQHWDALPTPAREILQKIEARSATLRRRIQDILILGEMRGAHERAAEWQPVPLRALITAIIGESQAEAARRGLTVAQSGDDCIVRSDPRQLRPLLANLIANAVAYSRDNTTIDIGLQASPDGACCVRVSDRGIGIPADKLPRIFDEYYRTAEAARVNRMSTGLGLAIVRQAARNLGLSITVTSEPGSGTQFAVRFPKQMEADSGECTHH